jgi:vacuolar protein sorting-associated protein 54
MFSSRPGSSGRYQPRRGSTASSIHSIGGTLDTASHWHGLNESGQNGEASDSSNGEY